MTATRTKTEAQAALVRRYARMLRAASGTVATNRTAAKRQPVTTTPTRRFTR
jgi:hypothetical protein